MRLHLLWSCDIQLESRSPLRLRNLAAFLLSRGWSLQGTGIVRPAESLNTVNRIALRWTALIPNANTVCVGLTQDQTTDPNLDEED